MRDSTRGFYEIPNQFSPQIPLGALLVLGPVSVQQYALCDVVDVACGFIPTRSIQYKHVNLFAFKRDLTYRKGAIIGSVVSSRV
jgi:hypothetical protein